MDENRDRYPFIYKIDTPDDVKAMNSQGRIALAKELRDFIIENVSKTGGHLAPSLGVIELTIALLSLYSPPFDKIVWDVGHQAYPYKILTGRRDRFDTIRQKSGLSGFPKISESKYDAFGVGHASTSIGVALGMTVARDIKLKNYKVVSIIGDGAMTGGLAFEGLNNVGVSGKDLLVILNDNEMSISRNVGALSRYLTEIIANERYRKIKGGIWDLTKKVPLTDQFRYIGHKLEDSIKSLVTVEPGMLFEGLGFDYFGPIDGHNIDELIKILHEIEELHGPKLLHILTKKGKGYKPAESDACTYHGIGSFDPETGLKKKSPSKTITYTEAFGDAMVEMADHFPGLCGITAAMEVGTGLTKFHKNYPERFFDVGIAEGHAVLFGSSMSLSGIPTVVAIYSSFLQRALDQVIHDVALQKIPLTFALDRAGIVGEDGPTHHGAFDLSYLRSVPGLVISAPADEEELRNLLYTSLLYKDGPFAIRYPRSCAPGIDIHEDLKEIPIGKWETIKKDGDIAILAVGSMVQSCREAIGILEEKGVNCSLYNARFVKPLDTDLLSNLVETCDKIVTVEENSLLGGFGEAVVAEVDEKGYKGETLKLGIPDRFIEHGTRDELLSMLGLDPEGIVKSIMKFVGMRLSS